MFKTTFRPKTDINILIALGANTPNAGHSLSEALNDALSQIDATDCRLTGKSRLFNTPCFPEGAGPDYINAAAAFQTSLSAQEVLNRLHFVEKGAGRDRTVRWAERTLDLDLLAFGDAVSPDLATFQAWRELPLARQKTEAPDRLILPHPRMHERAFVLIPLMDVAPDWRHPVLGLTVRQMVQALPDADKSAICPVAG